MSGSTIPLAMDQITAPWLTQALHDGGVLGDGRVAAVVCEPVGQGVGLLCQIFRLRIEYGGNAGDAPPTLIAKLPTTEPQTRQMVSLFRFYEREVRFYNDLAGMIPMQTPRRYASAFDPASGDFALLLEDLADRRLGDQLDSCSLDEARLIVTELGKLHARWWNDPHLAGFDWLPEAGSAVNKAGMALYPMAWGPFMERFGHKLSPGMIAVGERLGPAANGMLERFSAPGRPLTICHGDSRLDNFFFARTPADPPLTVIDWQIAIRATGTYDIGYFTSQSLDIDTRRAHEHDLLRLYHETLRQGGVTSYSFDDCLEDYRWALLFCFAYPVMGGGLGDLSNERGYALANAMMERSATAITDWDAGALLDA